MNATYHPALVDGETGQQALAGGTSRSNVCSVAVTRRAGGVLGEPAEIPVGGPAVAVRPAQRVQREVEVDAETCDEQGRGPPVWRLGAGLLR